MNTPSSDKGIEPELNLCPTCGGRAVLETTICHHKIICEDCHLQISRDARYTKEGVAKLWNRRAPITQTSREEHCKDCCCERSWKALEIYQYNNKSIPENITALKEELAQLKRENEIAIDALKYIEGHRGGAMSDIQRRLTIIARNALTRISSPPAVEDGSYHPTLDKHVGIKDTLKVNESVASPTPLQDKKADDRMKIENWICTRCGWSHTIRSYPEHNNAQFVAKKLHDEYNGANKVNCTYQPFPCNAQQPSVSPVSEPKIGSMDYCLEKAAKAWCHPDTLHKVMDADLARAFALILRNELNMKSCEPKETKEEVSAENKLKSIVKSIEKNTQCNCDLDNWQPERDTGHSWVCRIHKAAKEAMKSVKQQS